MSEPPLLSMKGITKRFPGVRALTNVSLELDRGEVLALVGENGAGKSTLMKILAGVHLPDEGEVRIEGAVVTLRDVATSKASGIVLIHQELMLASNLDVAGNIFLGAERGVSRGGARRRCLPRLDRRGMHERAVELLERVGLNVSPGTLVRNLTTGQMQMVEIAKALALDARIIVMDEPTSSLTSGEAEKLFAIVDELRRQGIAVIYISHRMDEILRIADRITVLRDGERVGDLDAKATSHGEIISMMVGRELSSWFPRRETAPGPTRLEVDGLIVPGAPEGVSFAARRGEILGFAGLVGSGRTELMQVIFGVDPSHGGVMRLDGEIYAPRRPADAIAHGVYLAPEDRKIHGVVLGMSVAENISLPDIQNYGSRWILERGVERQKAEAEVARMAIKTPNIAQRVVNLSGGNQQKVVLGKWLAMSPRVLILDEPTRGIDVGAKAEIYKHMTALADSGITILMVSSEMEEVLGMSDRVAVFHERRLQRVLEKVELSEERIMSHMTGRGAAA